MGANSFGERFQITSFGESHGTALGVVIDGCPAGVRWQEDILKAELARRRPGRKSGNRPGIVTDRNEADLPEILSGVYEGMTLGTPIAMLTRNQDARSEDYKSIAMNPRRGHADDLWKTKFGHADPRGGGRASGRETVSRVMAGAVAQMYLRQAAIGLRVTGFMRQAGPLSLTESEIDLFAKEVHATLGRRNHYPVDNFVGRFPSSAQQNELEALLVEAKQSGKSYGGTAEIWIDGCPENLGQPVFHKLKASLANALFGVGAVSAVEVGAGINATQAEGSEFHSQDQESQNHYGGIRGGISTGERILIRVSFKATSSVLDVAKRGRHDPCIVPRAIPVLEAMCYLVIADHVLWALGDKLSDIRASPTFNK